MNLLIRLVLSLAMVIAAPLQTLAQTPKRLDVQKFSPAQIERATNNYARRVYAQNPLLEEFVNDDPLENEFKKTIAANHTAVDTDPFFIRSQQWVELSQEDIQFSQQNEGLVSRSEDNYVEFFERGWSHKLVIKAPVSAILDGTEHIFLTANTNKIFADKIGNDEDPAQGIFYLSKSELFKAAQAAKARAVAVSTTVPMYLLPLPEKGWTGSIPNFELADNDSVVFYNTNTGTPLPIQQQDIRDHHKTMTRNLALVKAQWQMGKKSKSNLTLEEIAYALPARGSTASFGNFITGIDLDHHTTSFWASTNFQKVEKALDGFTDSIFPKANASMWDLITPDAMERLLFIGKIVGGAFVASFAIKYAFFFDKFKRRYINRKLSKAQKLELQTSMEKAQTEGTLTEERKNEIFRKAYGDDFDLNNLSLGRDIKNLFSTFKIPIANIKVPYPNITKVPQALRIATNEVKGHFDTYASMLTTVAMMFTISSINILEFAFDKLGSRVGMGAKNNLVRIMFDGTFGWTRSTMEQLAVNGKTWWLGAIVMGSVDTALVVVQLLWLTPLILAWMGAPIVATAGSTAVAVFVTSEIIRNMVGYFNSGAYGYSQDQKLIEQDPVTFAVDNELRRKGINPKDQSIQAKRQRMIDAKIDTAMRLRGLPGSDQFLFDTDSITRKFTRENMGYSTHELDVPEKMEDQFVLNKGRWGLARPSLNTAIRVAKKVNKNYGSEIGTQTVEILELIRNRNSQMTAVPKTIGLLSTNLAKKLMAGLPDNMYVFPEKADHPMHQVKETRKLMTLLSFGENVSQVLEYLPDWYNNLKDKHGRPYSKEALIAAAKIYSGALKSKMSGNPDHAYISEETSQRVERIVEYKAISNFNLKGLFGEEFVQKYNAAYGRLKGSNDSFLNELARSEATVLLDAAIKKKAQSESFQPKKGDWLAVHQKQRAHKRALIELDNLLVEKPEMSDSDKDAYYNQIYAKQLSKGVGLYPSDQSEFVSLVHEKTKEATDQQLATDNESYFLASLNTDEERKKRAAEVYAENFLETYMQLSIKSDKFVHHGSPEQPGRFQALRKLLRSNDEKVVTEDKVKEEVSLLSRINPFGSKGPLGLGLRIVQRSVHAAGDFIHDPNTKLINGVRTTLYTTVQGIEAFWYDDAFKPGVYSMMTRWLPLMGDALSGFGKKIKTWPLSMSLGYLFAYHIWQIHYDYPVWGLFVVLGFTHIMMVQINNRLMKSFGRKPMGGTWSKIEYAVAHSFFTFPIFIPIMLYADPLTKWWNANVIPHWNNALSTLVSAPGAAIESLGSLINSSSAETTTSLSSVVVAKANEIAVKGAEVAASCQTVLSGM